HIAYLLVLLERNRRCNGDRRISRADCEAYANWRAAYGEMHRTRVSPGLRRFSFIDDRREGWKTNAVEIARLFDLGVGGPPNAAAAETFYRMAIDAGPDSPEKAEANYRMGWMYEQGRIGRTHSSEQRLEFAEDHYTKAADGGHALAAYVMAHISLAHAEDRDQAWRKSWAANYFRQAANAGVADAAWRYARMLETGEVQERRGPESLLEYYRKGAAGGHVPSMAGVARAYANGWGVRQNEREAEEWWKRAAHAGDPESAWIVANRMARRDDFGGGLPYLRRAAQGGYPGAREQLNQWDSAGVRERNLGNMLLDVLDFAADIGAEYERQRLAEVAVQEAQQVDYAAALYAAGHYSSGAANAGGGSGGRGGQTGGSSGDVGGHLVIEDTSDPERERRLREIQVESDRNWADYRAKEDARWARFRAAQADARARASRIGGGSCRENCGGSRQ
ncbi:MAG: sel1 repeat family protein, partial [Brevundimonas sp.]|nr:sel1 repeat family protein [Brevundimonas sp.]